MATKSKYSQYVNQSVDRKKIQEYNTKGASFWKPEGEKNRIRIMPPRVGSEDICVPADTHFKVGPDHKIFLCRRLLDERCPICDYAKTADDDVAKEIYAGRQFYFNIFDYRDPDKGIQIARFGRQIFGPILAAFEDEDEYPVNIVDPDGGRDIIITRENKGQGFFGYVTQIGGNPKPWSDAIVAAIEKAEGLPDLLAIRRFASSEEMLRALDADVDDDDDDWNDLPATRKARRDGARPVVEDEDDEDDDDDFDTDLPFGTDDDGDDEVSDDDDESDDENPEADEGSDADDEDDEGAEEAPASVARRKAPVKGKPASESAAKLAEMKKQIRRAS